MIKLSMALAVAGLALVLASAVPWGAGGASAPPPAPTPTPATAQMSAADYGKALFSAKGCVTCHHHAGVRNSGTFSEGLPDLSAYHGDADYLRKWLKDPSAVKPGTDMPTLGLKDDEIEALIAFLSAGPSQ
jgi:cytochrome c2